MRNSEGGWNRTGPTTSLKVEDEEENTREMKTVDWDCVNDVKKP